jgi:hypothetical protein
VSIWGDDDGGKESAARIDGCSFGAGLERAIVRPVFGLE